MKEYFNKFRYFTIGVAFVLLIMLPSINAQTLPTESGGTTPENGSLFGLERVIENINLAISGDERKTRLNLEYAQERLQEINSLINKWYEVREHTASEDLKTIKAIDQARVLSEQHIEDAQESSENLSPEFQEAVGENINKHIEVLKAVLEKAPEEARFGLKTAIENSQRVFEKVEEAMEKSKQIMGELTEQGKQNPPKTRSKPTNLPY